MVSHKYFILSLPLLLLTACLNNDSGSVSEGPTDVLFRPRNANQFVCNPFNEGNTGLSYDQGVHGQLYYLDSSQPQYGQVGDYLQYGNHVNGIDIFFNQLHIPTRPFDRGFVTRSGEVIKTLEGNTLYEWFAMKFQGRLQLDPSIQNQGPYQLALLADDGAILRVDSNYDGQYEELVNNDGTHPTRMGCSSQPLNLSYDDVIPFELDYYQGPRFHIALVVLWRPWPAVPLDPECNKQGNSRFFDSTANPPAPQQSYSDLLSRGWQPLAPENYMLPVTEHDNPCNAPAPVISNVVLVQALATSARFTWTTDIPSTSQVIYTEVSSGIPGQTGQSSTYVTAHDVTATGLKPNTLYSVKVRSASTSGLSSESASFVFRSGR